ncbi:hypothetical protein SAM23877_3682 [Streptomyces ambofaciens ATCC 23877]|uniref:Uncharacterized protein n=1 Tax=Streptomyces ambofaciens (strain ATCC 23877 / 3486 / DSM 40053 / JCM 4204 / NBRC 12836 / NRRL B-2516) TaxID=278992 RepID=A0A0K2AV79_STRA7|nr:hypothetical protein SAM23877_3682 [Streptomyces ambofaciens ATCC 23877]
MGAVLVGGCVVTGGLVAVGVFVGRGGGTVTGLWPEVWLPPRPSRGGAGGLGRCVFSGSECRSRSPVLSSPVS